MMRKNKHFVFALIFLIRFNLSNACGAINSVNVREMARVLSDSIWNLMDFDDSTGGDFQIIQPGTKWCGAGNVAENYDDLGSERETDICCRDHDYCPDFVEAGHTKHNLTNEAFYTRLSCKCDEQFRQCLRKVNRGTANNIGTVYFNALATKCFRKDYPIASCVRRGGWLKRKCLEYTYDTSAKKLYQWFDVNNY